MITKKFIDEHIKAYSICNILVEGNDLVLRHKVNGSLYKFVNSQERIQLSAKEKAKVKEWIQETK